MKIKYIVVLCVCIVCIAACLYMNSLYQKTVVDDGKVLEELRDSIKNDAKEPSTVIDLPETKAPETDPPEISPETEVPTLTETESPETTPPETDETSPTEPTLDFTKLWEINPEICAWIEIEGTKIDYPVLQSVDNDKKYLTTAYNGTYYAAGSIFTEATYNSTDFNDPVTMIYGHTMWDGTMFGQLQKIYSVSSTFKEKSDIKLYLPDEVRHYTVFAAVPFAKKHVLDMYDFSVDYWYNSFFKKVSRVREIGANFDRSIIPQPDDRVIILSVCLNEDTTRRYLVMAILNDDLYDNK
ncbi:MAG: sortase [Clostridia bacterium]|nr:sortase [Clostridia bacterium]